MLRFAQTCSCYTGLNFIKEWKGLVTALVIILFFPKHFQTARASYGSVSPDHKAEYDHFSCGW